MNLVLILKVMMDYYNQLWHKFAQLLNKRRIRNFGLIRVNILTCYLSSLISSLSNYCYDSGIASLLMDKHLICVYTFVSHARTVVVCSIKHLSYKMLTFA